MRLGSTKQVHQLKLQALSALEGLGLGNAGALLYNWNRVLGYSTL